MFLLDEDIWFPPTNYSTADGLLAYGGDLSVDRLLLAYRHGIFPWYNPGDSIMWWAPPQRMVIEPKSYKAPKSLAAFFKRSDFNYTMNEAFEQVIRNCQTVPRNGQDGTWITDEIVEAYIKLHQLGLAKSVEVWQNKELVGGLYGVDLGLVFTGESMFSKVSNASKCAFVWLIQKLEKENYALLDCQLYNEHLAMLGAFEMDRDNFNQILDQCSFSVSNK